LALLIAAFVLSAQGCIIRDPTHELFAIGQGVRIAVIDSPVESHPLFDIGPGLVYNDDDSDTTNPQDARRPDHGMFVASAIKQVAPGADIAVYGLGSSNWAWRGFQRMVDAAIEDGSDVIVIAGGPGKDSFLGIFERSIRRAEDAGVLVVTSAGNNGNYTDCPEGAYGGLPEGEMIPPAIWDFSNVLVVGGAVPSDPDDPEGAWELWDCSIKNELVDIYAPAELSNTALTNGRVQKQSTGTSGSAALIAGTVALFIEVNEELRGDPEAITRVLRLAGFDQTCQCRRSGRPADDQPILFVDIPNYSNTEAETYLNGDEVIFVDDPGLVEIPYGPTTES
jgi:subtilisin family serine protease